MTTSILASFPSPPQGVWYLGPVPIRAYALCIIVGIVVALIIGDRRWVARGGEQGVVYDIVLWAVPFGLIGGRLYHVITDWPKYFGEGGAGLAGVVRIWEGGLGIWGAVALGGVGAWIGCRLKGIPLPAFGDAVAPGIVLAQAIGRLGNYFNQELYGRPTTLPWGLEIYERRNAAGYVSPDLANGVSTGELVAIVHPTFLYELLWNVGVFVFLLWADRRFRLGHGRLFALYVAGYCAGRFWIELLRDDDATLIAGIRINSFTSAFVFIGAVVYLMAATKGREDPASLKGKPRDEAEELTEELAAVGATSGVVAAAKAAGTEPDELSVDPVEPTSDDIGVEIDETALLAGAGDEAAEPLVGVVTDARQLAIDAEDPFEEVAEAANSVTDGEGYVPDDAPAEPAPVAAADPSPEPEPAEPVAVSAAETPADPAPVRYEDAPGVTDARKLAIDAEDPFDDIAYAANSVTDGEEDGSGLATVVSADEADDTGRDGPAADEADGTAGGETPADAAEEKAEEAPGDEAGGDEAAPDQAGRAADEVSSDEAPADEAPAGEAEEDQAGEAPADEAPGDEPPADEGPADEPPADEAPADEAAPKKGRVRRWFRRRER